MNEKSTRTDIDEFVDRQSPELRCTARELVDIIRNQLEDADERVEAGKAIFSKNGTDVSGVVTDGDQLGLFVPQQEIADSFEQSLGKVQVESDEIRFEKLEDLKRRELKKLIAEQKHESEKPVD